MNKGGRPRLDPSGECRDQVLSRITPSEKVWLKEQLKARRLTLSTTVSGDLK